MDFEDRLKKSEAVGMQLSNVMASLAQLAKDKMPQCPAPGIAYEQKQKGLSELTINIAIIGEQKEGKSSFVNALLGTNLLPTAVETKTSQMFDISYGEKESYAISFLQFNEQNDSAHIERIAFDLYDSNGNNLLEKFGTQTDEDILKNERIAGREFVIEVRRPSPLLGKGVHIFDTPGLGAVYKQHAHVTKRCIKNADIVFFVSDVNKAFTETEIETLKEIYAVTKQVVFIQTKKDYRTTADVEQIIADNRTILQANFGENDYVFIPVSSENALTALTLSDEQNKATLWQDSNFDTFMNVYRQEILTFICKELGLAVKLCETFSANLADIVSTEKIALEADSKTKEDKLNELRKMQKAFNDKWGTNGSALTDINACLNTTLSQCKNVLLQQAGPTSTTCTNLCKEVDTLSKKDEFETFCGSLPNRIKDGIAGQYETAISDSVIILGKKMAEYKSDFTHFITNEVNVNADIDSSGVRDTFAFNFSEFCLNTLRTTMAVGVGGTIGLYGGAILAALFIANPVIGGAMALLGAAIGGIWSLISILLGINNRRIVEARNKLKNSIKNVFAEISRALTEQKVGVDSPIDDIVKKLKTGFVDSLNKLVNQEKELLQSQIDQFMKNYDPAALAKRKNELNNVIKEHSTLMTKLTTIKSQIQVLK